MPEDELYGRIARENTRLLLLLSLLLVVGIAAIALITKKYIAPIAVTIDLVKQQKLSEAPRTRITEIDDLIEFLAAHDDALQASQEKQENAEKSFAVYDEFVRNIGTLSAAERAVFDLYLQGHTAQEIAGILFLSINTIKTHNKRIYMKLNVSSRKELMLFVQMMRQAGDLSLRPDKDGKNEPPEPTH